MFTSPTATLRWWNEIFPLMCWTWKGINSLIEFRWKNSHRQFAFAPLTLSSPYRIFWLMFAITKCKFCVDSIVYGTKQRKIHEPPAVNNVSPPFGLVMIVERLIKIHRRPIYLHYSLLQMWSFKLQNVSREKTPTFFISTPAYHWWRKRRREKQFKNTPKPWKITQFSSCIRIKRLQKQIALRNMLTMIKSYRIGSNFEFYGPFFLRWL